MKSSVRAKFSRPHKLVKTEQEPRVTSQSDKLIGSGMAAPQGALSASTPETTDGARLEEHIARHALKDSERRSKLLTKARGKVDTRITSWPARQVERAD